jgi:hypothetical protein
LTISMHVPVSIRNSTITVLRFPLCPLLLPHLLPVFSCASHDRSLLAIQKCMARESDVEPEVVLGHQSLKASSEPQSLGTYRQLRGNVLFVAGGVPGTCR